MALCVAWGVVFLCVGLASVTGLLPSPQQVSVGQDAASSGTFIWGVLVALGGFVVAAFASGVIGRYYRRAFGDVQADPQREYADRKATFLLINTWLAATILDDLHVVRISARALAIAWFLLVIWWRSERIRTHYAVMAGLLIGVGFLPLLGGRFNTAGAGLYASAVIPLLVGVIFLIGGTLDHLLLVRLLAQARHATAREDTEAHIAH
jgi:hypothetical protein